MGQTKACHLLAVLAVAAAPMVVPPPADGTIVRCAGLRATIVATSRGDHIVGTAGRDVIAGRGGNDRIEGRGGGDVVCGGPGFDVLIGGLGNDHLHGGPGADGLAGGPGDDQLHGDLDGLRSDGDESVLKYGDSLAGGPGDDYMAAGWDSRSGYYVYTRDTLSWNRSATGVQIDLRSGDASGEGRDSFVSRGVDVYASRHSDIIEGSDRAEGIIGGGGGDMVNARGGDDLIRVDAFYVSRSWADVVDAGAGNDLVEASGGSDLLAGGPGDDRLSDDGSSSDVIQGGDGADVVSDNVIESPGTELDGGDGDDEVNLGGSSGTALPGTGTMDLSSGEASFDAGTPTSFLVRAFEQVTPSIGAIVWTIDGTDRAETIYAWHTAGTTFVARGGDDAFMGSAAADTFDGGDGTDRNLGMGGGDNTCVSVEVDDDGSCPP